MTIKDNKFALELFVANHNADSEDQLEIIKDIPYIPKTVAILATTNGKIEQYIDFEKPLQPQTLWFIANRKVPCGSSPIVRFIVILIKHTKKK